MQKDFACQQTFTRLPYSSPKVLGLTGSRCIHSLSCEKPKRKCYALSLDTGLPLRSTHSLTDSRFERMVQMYYTCTRTVLRKLSKILSKRTTSGGDSESLQLGHKLIADTLFPSRFIPSRGRPLLAAPSIFDIDRCTIPDFKNLTYFRIKVIVASDKASQPSSLRMTL